MNKTVIILSALLQLFYLWALLALLASIFNILGIFETGDPKLVAGSLAQEIVTSLIKTIPGLIGLIISWRIIVKKTAIPNWFKNYSKILSYFWLLFIPIGTVLAVIQLKHLNKS